MSHLLRLPDLCKLRDIPESGTLAILTAALHVADETLRHQHQRISRWRLDPECVPSDTELIAQLLVDRFVELNNLIARYEAAVAVALGKRPDEYELPY